MADRAPLQAISGFKALAIPTIGSAPSGLLVAERRGLGLATVALRRDGSDAFEAKASERFNLKLAAGPRVSTSEGIAFVGIGPNRWLGVAEGGGWRFAKSLAAEFAGIASVCDQSSGYAVLRLSGPKVREVLAKGVPIDLHPSAFTAGDAAVTLARHVGIVLWQVDAAPTYDVAVFRSFAGDFWHWLETSAAEFGLAVAEPLG